MAISPGSALQFPNSIAGTQNKRIALLASAEPLAEALRDRRQGSTATDDDLVPDKI